MYCWASPCLDELEYMFQWLDSETMSFQYKRTQYIQYAHCKSTLSRWIIYLVIINARRSHCVYMHQRRKAIKILESVPTIAIAFRYMLLQSPHGQKMTYLKVILFDCFFCLSSLVLDKNEF